MKTLSFIFIFLVAIIACKPTQSVVVDTPPNASTYTAENPVITFRKTACKGRCPVYELVIQGDGTATLTGKENLDKIGKYTLKLSNQQIQVLVDAFKQAGFWELQDVYDSQVTDVPTTYTGITLDGKTKQVKNRFGAPQSLKMLEDTLAAIVTLPGWQKSE